MISNCQKLLEYPVVVKSCKEFIGRGFKERKGMFHMDLEQHNKLIEDKGYYLFKVEHSNKHTTLSLVKASEIKHQNNITWSLVMEE